jgi:hypothetical protein
MSAIDFTHELEICVPLAQLHDFLCDLQNYVPLHPLIESIEEISPLRDTPRARRYRVVDRIPFGPIKIRTIYTASLEPVSDREVHGHAWQSPGIRLDTVYRLEPVGLATRLSEQVAVFAPRLLRGIVISQARKSHEQMLGKVKLLLERANAD